MRATKMCVSVGVGIALLSCDAGPRVFTCENLGLDDLSPRDTVIAVGQTFTPQIRNWACGGRSYSLQPFVALTQSPSILAIGADGQTVTGVSVGVGAVLLVDSLAQREFLVSVAVAECHLYGTEPRRPNGGWCKWR